LARINGEIAELREAVASANVPITKLNRHSSDSRCFEDRIAPSGVFGNCKSRVECAAGSRSSQ
jgi:hypothetical protein